MRKGIATLPLHYGKAPPWLFRRMVRLAEAIIELTVLEHGREEFLRRFSDPFWFQAFGCVLGFDWHSSGLTTTVCGAVKEALKNLEGDIGIFTAGGKGKSAINTPKDIERVSDALAIDLSWLSDVSRLVAKVDNTLLQDGYSLYHHFVLFTEEGFWCVVQQGLNESEGYARRYHWLSEETDSFVEEPHSGISSPKVHEKVMLNGTAKESKDFRKALVDMFKNPDSSIRELGKIKHLELPARHYISPKDLDLNKLEKLFEGVKEQDISDFEGLLKIKGLGAKRLRALAFVSELIYGTKPSFKDPATFSYAHGGKDGHPFPVQKDIYDASIETLKRAIDRAKLGNREKIEAIKRLSRLL